MTSPCSFVWHELSTTDADAAIAFYCAVVGWQADDMDVEGKRYTRLMVDGMPVAGLMTLPPEAAAAGATTGWTGYIGVTDLDTMLGRVQQAGGTALHPAMEIPAIGRFVTVADPQGAVFAMFQPLTPMPGEPLPPGKPGTAGWHELHAEDWPAAFDLYSGLFGWQKADAIDMGPIGIYQLFSTGGMPTGGMMTRMDATRRPAWLYYFNVASIDAAVSRIAIAGGQVVHGPVQVPGGSWIVNGIDPQGGQFALVAPPG